MIDRLKTAGIVTLEGMVVIFVVLALLWGAVELLHFAFSRAGKKKATAPIQSEPTTETVIPTEPVADEDAGVLVAVITAAIAASLTEEGYTGGFRVVSFRRANNSRKNRI